MPQLSIAHVIYHLGIGGGEVFLADLGAELARRGVSQHVFCVGPGGPVRAVLDEAGVPVKVFGKRTRLGLGTLMRLARHLRQFGPDVVQVHGEAGLYWGLPAARLAGLKRVVALVYQNYPETRAKMGATRALLPRATLVVAGSDDVRRFVVERFGVPPARVVTVPCGADLQPFRAVARAVVPAACAEGPVLVSVGRLVERKGHEVAVRAMPRVLRAHPRAQLRIVGEGPVRERLERVARELGVADHVRLRGPVWPAHQELAGADVMLFPSLVEPQGIVVVEAFAAGVPVIASDTGGIPEMVADGETGVLVPPGDSDALADAVVALVADAPGRARLTQAASRVAEAFDIRRLATRYLEICERLAGEGGDAAAGGSHR